VFINYTSIDSVLWHNNLGFLWLCYHNSNNGATVSVGCALWLEIRFYTARPVDMHVGLCNAFM